MSQGTSLPARPNLDWYRKAAKKKLAELRAQQSTAKLADAQLAVAREHGFPSWRKLVSAIETSASDAQALLTAAGAGDVENVRRLLDSQPSLIGATDDQGLTPLHHAV